MAHHPLRKVAFAWATLIGTVAVFAVLYFIAPDVSLKAADFGWNNAMIAILAHLVVLPMALVVLIVTVVGLFQFIVDQFWP